MIDPNTLANTLQQQIALSAEQAIQDYVTSLIRELSLDASWIKRIEQQINDAIMLKFGHKLSTIDINHLVKTEMDQALDRYFDRNRDFFQGIQDHATTTQLRVTDGQVVVDHALLTDSMEVTKNLVVKDSIVVNNLAVQGTINTDNRTWRELQTSIAQLTLDQIDKEWRDKIAQQVKQEIATAGIDIERVTVDGVPLIHDHTLGAGITASSLTCLGTLDQLRVSGDSDLNNSLSVRNRRVGINTQDPDMALAIWDEEVALVFGKHREQTAYVGTLRPQRLIIGINRSPAIDITEQGRVTINHLTVGRHRVCHEPDMPNYSGTKGDIVFNSNPKNDGVWGWQCLGAFKWTPLRSA